MMTRKVLIVENLSAGYDGHEVLKNISFNLNEGEKLIIIGPSGSGKSTLLKCIVRLVEPWKGRIILDGIDVLDPKTNIRKVRAKTGFVFQSYNLFPHMKVIDNIVLPLRVVKKLSKQDAYKKAVEVLKIVGMHKFSNKYPLQLSGGQQQRVAIARALAMDPILLLLDEPTSALDPELREEVLLTLRDVAERGISMVIVTHELDFAEDVADRVIFIDEGVIVEEGNPWDLFYNPRNVRTRSFLRTIFRRMGERNL